MSVRASFHRIGDCASIAACMVGLLFLVACSPESDEASTEPLPIDEATLEQVREIEALQALGYVEGDQPAGEFSGVTLNRVGRALDGFNLYTSEQAVRVFLMDMNGELLHMWEVPHEGLKNKPRLRRVRLLEGGEILVLIENQQLVRLDRDSNVIWRYMHPVHHDFDVSEDGTIYVLTRETAIYPSYNANKPIRNNFIVRLSPNGVERSRLSLMKAFEQSICCRHFIRQGMEGDVFHSNTLEVLDGSNVGLDPAFKRGNILTSWRQLDAIGVIDISAGEVVWSMEDTFRRQHQPTLLENGNLLVFDNLDYRRGEDRSRVVELNPIDGTIEWEFYSTKKFPFFSHSGGSNIRLANGNTLITETRKGRVFEVDPAGEVVWIYLNPARVLSKKNIIARIYEMQQLDADTPMDWLQEQSLPLDALTQHTQARHHH